jgi:GAF domain-containing protein
VSAEQQIDYGWRPDDYIVHGRHCETAAVSRALGELRVSSHAKAAVLLVFRERTLFQSLLLVAHEDDAAQRRFQAALTRESPLELHEGEPALTELGDEKTASRRLRSLRSRSPLCAIDPTLAGDVRVASRPATEPPARSAGICVALAGAGPPSELERQVLDTLQVMVNATSSVVLHRDIAPEQDLDRVIRDVEREADCDASYEWILLEAARRLTHSSLGNFYLATRQRGVLELAAESNNANPRPKVDAKDRKGIVAYVYVRERALLINDLADFRQMHPNIGFVSVTEGAEDAFAELAVPVIQSLPSGEGNVVLGVLNVEKTHRDEGYYTDTELQLLRLIAERYGAWRLQQLLLLSAGTLEQLTRRSVQPTAVEELHDRPPGPILHLPADLWTAKESVDQIVRILYDLTRSESVTVRLVTSNQRRLDRFSAYPAQRLHDLHKRIKLDNDRSVNAYVARSGRERYVRDFTKPFLLEGEPPLLGQAQARPGIRSELCLPIVLEDRVVGTLNLESQLPDAFFETCEIIRAVAQQVALSFARARRTSEQIVFSMTSASTANVHELDKHARHLSKLARAHRDVAAIGDIAKGVRRCIRKEADRVDRENLSLHQILREIVRRRGWRTVVSVDGRLGSAVRFSEAHALPVKYAIEVLLHNAIEHQRRPGRFGVDVTPSVRHFGGRDYATLHIANPIRDPIPLSVAAVLYRKPVPEGDLLHIGAFTAAAGIRALGGEVYAVSLMPPRFEVVLDIPIVRDGRLQAAT